MTRTLQEKYSHVRGELKRARRRVQELEERNQFLEETLAMRERELATLRPTISGVGAHVLALLNRAQQPAKE